MYLLDHYLKDLSEIVDYCVVVEWERNCLTLLKGNDLIDFFNGGKETTTFSCNLVKCECCRNLVELNHFLMNNIFVIKWVHFPRLK